jgi:hypothetical protein
LSVFVQLPFKINIELIFNLFTQIINYLMNIYLIFDFKLFKIFKC